MSLGGYDGLTVAEGRWLYDDRVPEIVRVVAFDCDYFRERMPCDDGREQPDVPYPLNSEGRLYYLRFNGDVLPLKPFLAIDDAKRWANAQPWAPITWLDIPADA